MGKEDKERVGIHKPEWFVMRDFKRFNAKERAFEILEERGFEVFTPMKRATIKRLGMTLETKIPVIPDLLFVNSLRAPLDEIVGNIRTLTYRYPKGGDFYHPMYVQRDVMENFKTVVSNIESPVYYLPGEITPSMFGRKIRIVGGPLDGQIVTLLKAQGSKRKRFCVQLPDLLMATAYLDPEEMPYIILQ